MTKSIKLATNIIKKFKFDSKRSNFIKKVEKNGYKLNLLIKIDIFNILIDIFDILIDIFDLLIKIRSNLSKNRLILIEKD